MQSGQAARSTSPPGRLPRLSIPCTLLVCLTALLVACGPDDSSSAEVRSQVNLVQLSPERTPESAALTFKTRCRDLPFRGERSRLEVHFPPIASAPPRSDVLAPACSSSLTWPQEAANAAWPEDRIQLRQYGDQRTHPLPAVPIPFFIQAIDDLYPTELVAPHGHVAAIARGWGSIVLATHGGVSLLSGDGQLSSSLSARDGLAASLVQSLDGDDSRLWIGTSSGPCEALRDTREVSCWDDEVLRGDVRQIVQDPFPGGRCAWLIERKQGRLYRIWDDGRALRHALPGGDWNVGLEAMRWIPAGGSWELWAVGPREVTVLRRAEELPGDCARVTLTPSRTLVLPNSSSSHPAIEAGLGSNLARDPWSPEGRGVWLGRGARLYRLDAAVTPDPQLPPVETHAAGMPGLINALQPTADGLWIGTDAGLFWLARGADMMRATPIEVLLPTGAGPGPDPRRAVLALHHTTVGKGQVWVGLEQGLVICHEDSRACRSLPTRPPSFEGTRLTAAYKGSGRRFWVGDRQGGVHGLYQSRDSNRPTLQTCLVSSGDDDYRRAVTVLREQSGALWIGHEQGLRRMPLEPQPPRDIESGQRICPPDPRVIDIRFHPGGYPTEGPHPTRALAADRLGRIWIATSDGLYVSEDGSTAQRRVHAEGIRPILDLLIDTRNRLWLATAQGLSCYTGSELDVPCAGLATGSLPDDLARERITRLHQTSSGRVYIGTGAGALYQVIEEPGIELRRLPPPVTGGHLPAIRGLGDDREGNLWVLAGAEQEGTGQAWSFTPTGVWLGPYTLEHALTWSSGVVTRDWREALWLGDSLTWVTPKRECAPDRLAHSVKVQLFTFGLFMLAWLWIVNYFSLELFHRAHFTARTAGLRAIPLILFVTVEVARWSPSPEGGLRPLPSSLSPVFEVVFTGAVLWMLRTGILATTKPPVRGLILAVTLFSFLGWAFAGRGALPALGLPTLSCLAELQSHSRLRLFLELAGLAVLIAPLLLSLWGRAEKGEGTPRPPRPPEYPPEPPPEPPRETPEPPRETPEPPRETTEPPPEPSPGARVSRDQLFISYSKQDRTWLDRLQTHLKPRVRAGRMSVWADTQIKPGTKRRDELPAALARAKVAVLLLSPDYLASDYLQDYELARLLKAAAEEGLIIAWIAVRPCAWQETLLARFQPLNDPSRPLSRMHHARRDEELEDICRQLQELLEVPVRKDQGQPP